MLEAGIRRDKSSGINTVVVIAAAAATAAAAAAAAAEAAAAAVERVDGKRIGVQEVGLRSLSPTHPRDGVASKVV